MRSPIDDACIKRDFKVLKNTKDLTCLLKYAHKTIRFPIRAVNLEKGIYLLRTFLYKAIIAGITNA